METYVITKDNYRETMRAVRRQQHMTQHYAASILATEARQNYAPASQVSMWETGFMVPRLDNFLRWANAIGCDVVLIPRKQEEDYLGTFDEDDSLVAA